MSLYTPSLDREAVQQLEARVRSERTKCEDQVPPPLSLFTTATSDCVCTSSQALYYASLFLWLTGRQDKSREYVERLLKMVPESKAALSLRGWIDMTCGREGLVKKSIKYFEEAMSLQRYILHTLVLSYTHTFILSFLHITFFVPPVHRHPNH